MENKNTPLHQEWICLQNQQDDYEKYSLVIKLMNFALVSVILFIPHCHPLMILLIAAIWLQDGVWKTFQHRISERLMQLETAIVQQHHDNAMQFNTAWTATRPSSLRLMLEYAAQAMRPTVLFPHALLLAIASFVLLYQT